MQYRAKLTMEEVKKFCNDFYQLEDARATKVEIMPDERHISFHVVLVPEEICADFLEADFRDGFLTHMGWHKKFAKN